MRRLSRCLCAALLTSLLASPALAGTQDFQLYKLGNASSTEQAVSDRANHNFRVFSNMLGVALSSYNLTPPETLGHAGFNFALEYAAASVDTATDVWPREGKTPVDMLLMPSVHVRKGLPFSFELGGRFAYLQFSKMAAATVEAKWALNEGFVYFPDVGVRGHATHLIGSRDLNLTTAGLDIGVGKQLGLGGVATLTPYAGWNLIYVNASSNNVDFRPDRDPAEAQAYPTRDLGVFEAVSMPQNHNNRFYGGLRFISNVFEIAAEASFTKSIDNRQVLAFSTKLGLDF